MRNERLPANADSFAVCREGVTAEEAARRYGVEVKNGWCCCPFHNDKSPSLHFKNGRFRCYGCGASGSSIDFTARLLNLSLREAVGRLNDDFGLGLNLEPHRLTDSEREAQAKRRRLAEENRSFQTWKTDTANQLAPVWRKCNQLSQCDPDTLTEAQVMAVRLLPVVGFWLEDALEGKDEAEQKWLYAERSTVAATLLKIGEAGEAHD